MPLWIIYDARLQDNGTGERLTSTEESGATVAAEVGGDGLAGISGLGDALWRACTKPKFRKASYEIEEG